LCFLGACGGAPESLDQAQQEGRSWQGRSWQGRSWQGTSVQGTGPAVSTVRQIQLGGTVVDGLQLNGTVLVGSVSGNPIAGADFIGAIVTQQDVDGSTFTSTITNVQTDAQDPSGEILLYTLTAYDSATGTVQNICNPDPWGGQYATPVYGSWDSTGAHTLSGSQFMFGCTSGVVAKCVRWGYKPWKSVNGVALADYHQACTRMARADYCGDGVTHTMNGTLIDMYDDLGIQTQAPQDPSSPLYFEGAWTVNGAYCLSKERWANFSSLGSNVLSCSSSYFVAPPFESSPVSPHDVCAVQRSDLSRSQVHIDNQSGANIAF
jgi:hypothetical protein